MKISEEQLIAVNLTILFGYALLLHPLFQPLLFIRIIFGFLILTYFLGRSVRVLLINWVSIPSSFGISSLVLDITLSLLINQMISCVLILTFDFFKATYVMTVVSFNLGFNLLALFCSKRKAVESKFKSLNKRRFAYLMMIAITSGLMFVHFRNRTPLPTINGWDINPSLAYVNWIIENHGYKWILIPPYPEESFVLYPALFFYLVSSYSLFLGIPPLEVFWYGIYPLILGYMSTIFIIALKLSKNHILSFGSALAAFFLSCGLAEVVRSPLYLTPDMVGQLFFLLMFIVFLYYEDTARLKIIMMVVYTLYLAVFYYPTAMIGFPLLLYFIVGKRPLRLIRSGKTLFFLASSLLLLSTIAFTGPIASLGEFWFSQSSDISMKITIIQSIYSPAFWIFFILAFVPLIFAKRYTLDEKWTYLDLLFLIGVWAIIYFFPVQATYRVEFYMRTLLAIFISGVLLFPQKSFTSLMNVNFAVMFATRLKFNIKARQIVSALIFCFLIISLYPSFTYYTNNFYAYTSKDEYEAAIWICDNTPLDSYILTDPGSGYVIRGLTLRNSSTFFILPDGRMPADPSIILPNLRQLIHLFFNSESQTQAKSILTNFTYEHIYVVITSRTAVWVTCPLESIFTHPFENPDFSIFNGLLDSESFGLVHNSPSARIYLYNQTSSMPNK